MQNGLSGDRFVLVTLYQAVRVIRLLLVSFKPSTIEGEMQADDTERLSYIPQDQMPQSLEDMKTLKGIPAKVELFVAVCKLFRHSTCVYKSRRLK